MPVKVLHFSDVHLDRPFVGLPRDAARQRRNDLRAAFERCLAAARDHRVDLVTIGGDLWEDENVTADTRNFVAHELERAALPVLLICGNHDPYLAGGHYERTAWPENVHLFRSEQPSAYEHEDVCMWGISWRGGGSLDVSFLEDFRVPEDGRFHVLLLHGTARTVPAYLLAQADDAADDASLGLSTPTNGRGAAQRSADAARRYGPFDPARVERAGFALCLAGHLHNAYQTGRVVYPGSPEPLGWGEVGRHCFAIVELSSREVTEGGVAVPQLHDVNRRRYEDRRVVCDGSVSSAAVAERVEAALNDTDPGAVFLRVDLVGQVAPGCQIDLENLAGRHRERYAALVLRDRTKSEYDLEALARQRTATGQFVRTLRGRIAQAGEPAERETLELALLAGLHALNGRRDVVRVD
jgi:exonuclease SbcD